MVESLKELNRRCQKPDYKKVGNWMVRKFLRDAALPMTWLLLHTPVTANQVTFFATLVGILGGLCLGLPASGGFAAGALLLQFWYYLDHVDGQIARYRGTESKTGRFFDFWMHHVIHAMIFFPMGYYAFGRSGNHIFLFWGFFQSLGIVLFNLMADAKYKTFFEALSKLDKPLHLSNLVPETGRGKRKTSIIRTAFSWIHKLCEVHVVMNLLTISALIQWLRPQGIDFRMQWCVLYGIAIPLITVSKLAYVIHFRKIDEEFEQTFHA